MIPNHPTLDQSAIYEIQVEGQMSPHWLEYFRDLVPQAYADPKGQSLTILKGTFIDQAALMGTIQNLYNLGMALISVQRLEK